MILLHECMVNLSVNGRFAFVLISLVTRMVPLLFHSFQVVQTKQADCKMSTKKSTKNNYK